MRKSENPTITLEDALQPIINCGINLKEQRLFLNEMFAQTVANAPDNETDNFTAKKLKPFYLALSETLETLDEIENVHYQNILHSIKV